MSSEKIKKKILQAALRIKMIVFDFDGVFTDNRVLVFQDGKEAVFCNRSDGLGIQSVKELGVAVLVISNELNPIVKIRCEKLGVDYIQGDRNKLQVLKNRIKAMSIKLIDVAYLGNDLNDLGCLVNVGLPAAVPDAHPEVLRHCRYN